MHVPASELVQGLQHAVHLSQRVVMQEAQAAHAGVVVREAAAMGRPEAGIVVPRCAPHTPLAERLGQPLGAEAVLCHREGRRAQPRALRVAHSEHPEAAHGGGALQEADLQVLLVRRHGPPGRFQTRGAGRRGVGAAEASAQARDVVHRGDHAREALVALRPDLPARHVAALLARQAVVLAVEPLRRQLRQQLAAAEEHAGVGAEELVGGAGQEVTAQSLHVHAPVRRVVHGVHEAQRLPLRELARGGAEGPHVVDAAHAVGGGSGCDQPRSAVHHRSERLAPGVQDALADAGRPFGHGQPAHLGTASLGQMLPGEDVRPMADGVEDDVVARAQAPAASKRPGQVEGERRHGGAEDGLVGLAVQQVRHGAAGALDRGERALAGGVASPHVGRAEAQLLRHRGDGALVQLGAAGSVREDRRPRSRRAAASAGAPGAAREARELRPDGLRQRGVVVGLQGAHGLVVRGRLEVRPAIGEKGDVARALARVSAPAVQDAVVEEEH
mmetsp:Transcript_70564/g.222909  ORF Transcript_70564/g.222909 Transcript_70564/m.222909 type:complete len:501 (+) Transcript_70564:440-1942(+)